MDTVLNVRERLKTTYKDKLLPLELTCKFHEFYWPKLDDSYFEAKPLVLILGQYSTGKTTFIRHLLNADFPGMQIGPEPTTDKFSVVMYNSKVGTEPGHTVVMDSSKPFSSLTQFGSAFLSRFQCSLLDNHVLKTVTLVDTPGILSGENQSVKRGYDFIGVIKWFAAASDRILFVFDPQKLDISDEFRQALELFRDFPHKCKIVLNKVNGLESPVLLRVYGALMWNLGQVVKTPEVPRIYVGSFWEHNEDSLEQIPAAFELQKKELFDDILSLSRNTIRMKLNDIARRARIAKVQAYILNELKAELPSAFKFWISDRTKEAIKSLDKIFIRVQNKHRIPRGDLPNMEKMKQALSAYDIASFPNLTDQVLEPVNYMVERDIPEMINILYDTESGLDDNDHQVFAHVRNGDGTSVLTSACYHNRPGTRGWALTNNQNNAGISGFVLSRDKNRPGTSGYTSAQNAPGEKYNETSHKLSPSNGKIQIEVAKTQLCRTCVLSEAVLDDILNAADKDNDNMLDENEWDTAISMVKEKVRKIREEQMFQCPNNAATHQPGQNQEDRRDTRRPGQKSRASSSVNDQCPKKRKL